jgi:hypothetical protein
MRLPRVSALAFVLGAALSASACSEQPAQTVARPAAQSGDAGPYWLGPSYLGLRLRVVPPSSYIYGTCDAGPDSGCVPPYEVQHHRSCARNPLTGGGQPSRVYRVRGRAIAAVFGADVEVGVGRHTVVVFAHNRALAERAAGKLRRRGENKPDAELPAPVYPKAVLQELKRVAVAMRRLDDVRAVARRLGLPQAAVRARHALARLLPKGTLARVRVPKRPWSTVRRERRIALFAQALGRRATAERFDLSVRDVGRIVRRARGLSGRC